MGSIIPFIIISIANGVLIYVTVSAKGSSIVRTNQEKSKRLTISLMIITLSLTFILFTSPQAIAAGYFLQTLLKTPESLNLTKLFNALTMTYHSFNFIILYFTNKHFKKEIKLIFSKNSKIGVKKK